MQGTNFSEWGSSFCSSFGHGPWFFGWLFPLLFWGVAVYSLLMIVRHFLSDKPSEQNDSAFDILRNRYASGEINEQEYTQHTRPHLAGGKRYLEFQFVSKSFEQSIFRLSP